MEAKFNNISNIYSVFEILKDVKVDQTLNFKKSGIEIKDVSTDRTLVFEFIINGKNLVSYKYDGTVSKIGISTLYLCQVLKMIEKDTIMSLKVKSGITNKLIIQSKNQNCTKETNIEIDTNDSEYSENKEIIQINNVFYISMKNDEFYKTLTHFKNFGNSVVTIICTENVFRLECDSNNIKTNQEYAYDPKSCADCLDSIKIKYLGNDKLVKPIMATYSIDSILKFKKCTKLCSMIEINIAENKLITLQHDVGNIGKLKTIISPTNRGSSKEENVGQEINYEDEYMDDDFL